MAACASCASELVPGAKFCQECGAPAAPAACPSCGTPVTGGKFCSECGTPLTATAAPAAAAAEVAPPVAERRITSVLFGDLVGFTPLSECRDAEEVRELLSRYFAECRTVIGRYGGTVEKFIGDAVMAVWGVPVAHEDDAERAVRAGLELTSMVAGLGDQVGAPGLAMRVGIVTGEVAVTVGATAEGMVAGDAVNTAARVQSTAEPGAVWVDDSTRRLTAASVAYEDMGEHDLKGKAEPLHLFCARAIVTDMRGSRVDGLEAPMAGRDRELRLIKELFHAAEESGRPRLVVVDGEAGMGKSRLAWEFEKYIDGLKKTVLWHRGRCLSYGDGIAYWALTEAVRTRLGLTEGETGDIVEQRLDEGLAEFVPDMEERAWLRPRLGVLVRSDRDAAFTRSELFVAWTTWFEHLSENGDPIVLVVDDAHHADDGLLDFAEHLLSNASGTIFVLALARPALLDRRRDLGGRRSTVIHLEPLDDEAMSRVVDGLVEGLQPESRAALVERSEGVPLFAVETVRALIDRDLVVPRDGRYVPADGTSIDLDAIGAPATLQTLVAARLDALTPQERLVVADASVLGATFTRDGLIALSGEREELDDMIASLQRKEIFAVQQDRFAADRGQLRFVQTVVRQVAYSTQSKRDRKARHLASAEFLASAPDSDDVVQVQAQHLVDAIEASSPTDEDMAELTARAAALLTRAAERSHSLGATSEARRLFEAACERTTEPSEHARLLRLTGETARDQGDDAAALELFLRSMSEYDDLGMDALAGLSAGLGAGCLWRLGDSAAAEALARPRWEALTGRPDADEALMRLGATLVNVAQLRGDTVTVFQVANDRVMCAERLGDPGQIAFAMNGLAAQYMTYRAPAMAEALTEAAVVHARRADQLPFLCNSLINLAALNLSRNLAEAEHAAAEGRAVARRAGTLNEILSSSLNLVMALWQAGRLAEARQVLDETPIGQGTGAPPLMLMSMRMRVAAAMGEPLPAGLEDTESDDPTVGSTVLDMRLQHALAGGDVEHAADVAEQALQMVLLAMGIDDDFPMLWPVIVRAVLRTRDPIRIHGILAPVSGTRESVLTPALRAELHWFRGLAAAVLGEDAEQAEADIRLGIAELDAFGARGLAAQAREDLGRWLVEQGRTTEGDLVLAEARATYEDIGALGWLAQLDAWAQERAAV